MNSEELRIRIKQVDSDYEELNNNIESYSKETRRVRDVIKDTESTVAGYYDQFDKETKLNKTDLKFLFVAIGLQILKQYLTKFPERLNDQEAAKNTLWHSEEHSLRHHRLYEPSLAEIISNPVPFDANIGAHSALSGGGKMGHRVTAIGHDPILGLIFGTANIATSTLTTSSFESYHISTNINNRDFFSAKARTDLVLKKTAEKVTKGKLEGISIVAYSLWKEINHLMSDYKSKNSLPFPIVSAVDPSLASKLASYGLDMLNVITVGKQAALSILIDSLISMTHRIYYTGNSSMDLKLYEVKTRKILSYSHIVATSTNLAVVAVTKDMKNLDLGGLGVTIYRLITDSKFIKQVNEEFISDSYEQLIMGTL